MHFQPGNDAESFRLISRRLFVVIFIFGFIISQNDRCSRLTSRFGNRVKGLINYEISSDILLADGIGNCCTFPDSKI